MTSITIYLSAMLCIPVRAVRDEQGAIRVGKERLIMVMLRRTFGFVAAATIALSTPVVAATPSKMEALQYCEIDGFASGVGNRLVSGVAQQAASRAGVSQIDNKQCGALFHTGLKAGQRDKSGAVLSASEMEISRRTQAFEKRLMDALIDLLEKHQ